MTLTDPILPLATFRDPAGSLSLADGLAVRCVHASARQETLRFLESPLRHALEAQRDMVATSIAEDDGETITLHHPLIAVPTYPWEWTPTQWHAAADLTLRLCAQGLGEEPEPDGTESSNYVLKDATPLNILFDGPRPVLVDVLSFERRDPASRLWIAYAQYIRTFLLPLVMLRLLHWPLALSLFKRDGYEPADLYGALSWPQRLSSAAFVPITLPALLDRRQPQRGPATKSAGQYATDPGLTLHLLRRMLNGLRKRTRRVILRSSRSEWSDYKTSLTHYSSAESAQKAAWVRAQLEDLRPAWVLDIGANTGEFSALAASCGARVIALERDAAAADRLAALAQERSLDILTIHADLARPTPAAGWANAEQTSLLARLQQSADLVLLLAVIHHLLLMEQIPLDKIVALVHGMTRRYVVLEWVPVTDPMFQSLLRGRDALYGELAEHDLLAACEGRFLVRKREALANGRVLFLFERQA